MSKNSLMRQLLEKDFQERIDDLVQKKEEEKQEEKYTYADPFWDSMLNDDHYIYDDYCDDMYDDMLDRERDEYFNDYQDYNLSWYDEDYYWDQEDDDILDKILNKLDNPKKFHVGRSYRYDNNVYLCCQIRDKKYLIDTMTGLELTNLGVISQLS